MKAVTKIQRLKAAFQSIELQRFAQRYPFLYSLFVIACALFGFAYLLLFPTVAVIGLFQLSTIVSNTLLEDSYALTLLWYATVVLCVGVSYHIFTIKFPIAKGLVLAQNKVPKLFEFVTANSNSISAPKIYKIMLIDNFELDIVKLPIFGIPFWSKNILLIGIAQIQSLPQSYFECVVKRKIMQFSKHRYLISNWIYQMRQIWSMYPSAFKSRNLVGDQLIYWFFNFYTPFFQKISVYAVQKNELLIDNYSLTHINDRDLLKSIEAQYCVDKFLHHYYWPTLNKLLKQGKTSVHELHPFAKLPAAIKQTFSEEKLKKWLVNMQLDKSFVSAPALSLRQRLENIGHNRISTPDFGTINAAEVYFENNHAAIVKLLDNLWSSRMNTHIATSPTRTKKSATRAHTHRKTA